ncbi:hypothetical protein [Mesorhizobium sp. M7D.F.Ca.US.005.01.1.1]|uniref:hypothetical protein n=1 Tax=Mesorhizobium sp. M7D.F.Ca.US.005.01.1.1 TaxID=2493678 RepID=UPI001FE09A4F|nr:hypothetical protein [Mesorhizobium sp. M7D.F.Ca.US.005.01.1.1]
MTVDDPFKHPSLGSGVFYKDPRAALDWLEAAFGFARSMVVSDAEGRLVHAEMRFGDSYIIVDSEMGRLRSQPGFGLGQEHAISLCQTEG